MPLRAACWAIVALLFIPWTVRAQSDSAATAPPPDPDVTAAAAVVVDMSSGAILWGRDIHAQRALASVTKMMTALVVSDLASLDAKVTVQ